MNHEIKPVMFSGKIIPGYYISSIGKLWSTRIPIRNKGIITHYTNDGPMVEMTPIKWNNQKDYVCVRLAIPYGLLPNDQHHHNKRKNPNHMTYQRKIYVHRLVIETFKPLDLHPPTRLKPYWNNLPQPVKQIISEMIYVNHIDHNQTNNHINNLEWVTPQENSIKHALFKQSLL